MATTVISESSITAGDNITLAEFDDLIVLPGAVVASSDGSGIVLQSFSSLVVSGTVTGIVVVRDGDNNDIIITKEANILSADIFGESIKLGGSGNSVNNSGYIGGPGGGLTHDTGEGFSFSNSGTLSVGGGFAPGALALLDSPGAFIQNSGAIISSTGDAIEAGSFSDTPANTTIVNSGLISGQGVAVQIEGGSLLNSGHISGDVRVALDEDVDLGREPLPFSYDGRLGTISGVVRGGDADDTLRGGTGPETLIGRGGDDLITGGDGFDELRGGSGNDALRGNGGDDLIYGGKGVDKIVGGAGDDVLSGNADRDVFRFRQDEGHDIITDFQNNLDRLDLRSFGFQKASEVRALASDSGAGLLIDLTDVSGGTIVMEDFTLAQLGAADILI